MLIRFYISSFNSIVQLLTFVLLTLKSFLIFFVGSSIPRHIIRYQYFIICPMYVPLFLSLIISILVNQLAAQFGTHQFPAESVMNTRNSSNVSLTLLAEILYFIFDSRINSHIFSIIRTFILYVTGTISNNFKIVLVK